MWTDRMIEYVIARWWRLTREQRNSIRSIQADPTRTKGTWRTKGLSIAHRCYFALQYLKRRKSRRI